MKSNSETSPAAPHLVRHGRAVEIGSVVGGAALVISCVTLLSVRAAHRTNRTPLDATPRPVTVIAARDAPYRDMRTYVGAVQPWIVANVGPQYISAYVESVLVRPGAVVRRQQVLATLNCSHPRAETGAVAMRERAMDANMRAAADEASRVAQLLDGGFVAENEAELKAAASAVARAGLLETRANLARASLNVSDCVLRAPFDGEIGTRSFDPGAFVHPGAAIVSVVDRTTARVTVDAPERDFGAVGPGKNVRIEILSIGAHIDAPISRRAPAADPATRTIHFEVDVQNPSRAYPVGTTAVVDVVVGEPIPAVAVPTYTATQESGKAKLFVVDHGVAHARNLPVRGEARGILYFSPAVLRPGAHVVSEGRALLTDGERVSEHVETDIDSGAEDAGEETRGAGFGRPL